jgi:hypothetical protein
MPEKYALKTKNGVFCRWREILRSQPKTLVKGEIIH